MLNAFTPFRPGSVPSFRRLRHARSRSCAAAAVAEKDARGRCFPRIGEILHSIKSFTANEIKKSKTKSATVWEKEFDRHAIDGSRGEVSLYLPKPWNDQDGPNREYDWLWTWQDAAQQDAGQSAGSGRSPADASPLPRITGEFAFHLYDEQGFPLDLTELMARERGLTVDMAGFEKLMEEQRARARKAQKKEAITSGG